MIRGVDQKKTTKHKKRNQTKERGGGQHQFTDPFNKKPKMKSQKKRPRANIKKDQAPSQSKEKGEHHFPSHDSTEKDSLYHAPPGPRERVPKSEKSSTMRKVGVGKIIKFEAPSGSNLKTTLNRRGWAHIPTMDAIHHAKPLGRSGRTDRRMKANRRVS